MDNLVFDISQPTTQLNNFNFKKEISSNDDITKVSKYKIDQTDRLKQIKKSIDISSKNKAILSLKYDNIAFKINIIQISVIVFSGLITFIETLNSLYELSIFVGTVLPILFASYIAIILSIMRFFKMDDKKETIGKTLENFSYIINKSRKTKHRIKNFNITSKNTELWENLISNYENEIYDFLLNTREAFENILHYKELVYFKRRLLNHYVKNMFAHKNIDYVDKLWTNPHREYEQNLSTCEKIYQYFCCNKKNEVYFNFLNHLEDISLNDLKEDKHIQTEPKFTSV